MTQPDIYRPLSNNVSPWAIETMPADQLQAMASHAADRYARAAAARSTAIWSAFADPGDTDQAADASKYWQGVGHCSVDELADRLRDTDRRLADVTAHLAASL